jgi:dihydropteroate synthase
MEFSVRSPSRPRFRWQLRSQCLELGERTRLVAIVNLATVTGFPDAANAKFAVAAAVEAVDGGADIVELGSAATRTGAQTVSAEQETARLLPVLEGLLLERPKAIVSVDTSYAATARAAAKRGAQILKDVSGLTWDAEMAEVAAQSGCGIVLMHARGRKREWLAQGPMSSDEVVPAVFAGLCESVALAEAASIADERMVVDPGFGFGKRGDENFKLLAQLSRLHQLGLPMMVGLSRKGFLAEAVKPVQGERFVAGSQVSSARPGAPAPVASAPRAEARYIATVAGNVAAVLAGAHILRVHDLQAAREAVAVADGVLAAGE